uniref:Uncharacterized protein n=1 Tax=Ixodes ricinus TaxID=34613 RepID=A0A6B0UTX5_IXORI
MTLFLSCSWVGTFLFFLFLKGILINFIDMFIMLHPRMCKPFDNSICWANELTMGALGACALSWTFFKCDTRTGNIGASGAHHSSSLANALTLARGLAQAQNCTINNACTKAERGFACPRSSWLLHKQSEAQPYHDQSPTWNC